LKLIATYGIKTSYMKKKILLCALFAISFIPFLGAESQLVDQVVAIVNDEIITQSELDTLLRPIYEQIKGEYSGEDLMKKFTEIRRKLLSQLIEDRLVFQEAKTRGVEVGESEIRERIEEFKKNFPDEETFEKALDEQGLSLRDLEERFRRQAMIRRLHDMEIRSHIIVSPHDIENYYRDHASEFTQEERIKVRSLTVKKSLEAREKGLLDEHAKKLIQELRRRVLAGEDFQVLAKQYSEDVHAAEGGLSQWIGRQEMIPVIDEVIFNLRVGEISEIIETPMGYHVFRLEEKEKGHTSDLEEVRDRIMAIVFQKKSEERFNEWMIELKRNAYISIR